MTARERAELKGYVAPSTAIMRAVMFIIAGLCLAGILRALVEKTKPGAHFLWWAVPLGLVMLFLFARAKRWTGGRQFRQQIKADLREGSIAVQRVDVVEVIEVEEREDEGPGYFVKTTTGEVVVLMGQDLDKYKRRGFPWKAFEIIRAPVSKILFGLKKLEARLPPSFVREPFTWEEFKRFHGHNYKVIDADFESLKVKESGAAKETDPAG